MEPDQLVDVQFKLCTPRINHLINLVNAWSRCSIHYDRGPVHTLSLRWRPGDVHPLVVEDPGDDGGDDHGNEGGDDHGNDGGDDENPPGDDNIPPSAGGVNGNPHPEVDVVTGSILPGVVDDVVKADAVNMSGDDDHDDDDDLQAAAAAGKQRKRKASTDEKKNEKRQRRESSEYRTEEEGLVSN